MIELDGLLETTAERVRQEDSDLIRETGRGLLESSEGALEAFNMTEETDSAGAVRRETSFQRATRNMNLAGGMNSEAEAAAVRASRKTGMPVSATRQWDNQEKNKPDLNGISPGTQKFLGDDLSNAVVAKDDVEKVDAIVSTADYASMSLEDRRKAMLDQIKNDGYTAAQLADLKQQGYTAVDAKNGKFTRDFGGIPAIFTWPMSEAWYTNPEEAETLDKDRQGFDEAIKTQFDKVRGSAWFVNATPETQAKYIQTLDKEIMVMRGLWSIYGGVWQDFSDEELAEAVKQAAAALQIDDVSDISVNRLRPAGVGLSTTDWADLINFFGIQDFYEHFTGLSKEELDQVHRNPLAYPLMDRMDLVDELEKQAKELRGRTGWNAGTEMTITSLRFATELAAAGGGTIESVGTILKEQGIKGVPAALGKLFTGMAKLIPGRSMQAAETAIENAGPQITQIIENGQVLPGFDEAETDRLAEEFFNAVLSNYIEDVSEGTGAFLPVGKALGMASKLVPKRVRNAAFVAAMSAAVERLAKTKGAQWAKRFTTAAGFNGLIEEDFEEIIADAVRYGSTQLAESVGTNLGNFHQDEVFHGWEAEGERLLQLAATGIILQGVPRAIAAPGDIYRVKQFRTAQKAIKERVDDAVTTKRSPELMESLLMRYTRMSNWAYLRPASARTLFQSMPETMAAMGVTEDMIGEAETKERLIPVSMARVHTHTTPEEFDKVLDELIPDPENLMTPKDADELFGKSSEGFLDATAKAEEQRKEIEEAVKESVEQMKAAGVSDREAQAFSKLLLGAANYMAVHQDSGMTGAEWIRNMTVKATTEPEFLKSIVGENNSLYQGVIGIPGFYSNMMQSLADAPQEKMTPAQWIAYLQKSGGLKAGETSWRGSIEKFFEGRDPNVAVTRRELIDAFENGMVDILEMSTEDPVGDFGGKAWSMFNYHKIGDEYGRIMDTADHLYFVLQSDKLKPEEREKFTKLQKRVLDEADGIKNLKRIFQEDAVKLVESGKLTPEQGEENLLAMHEYLESGSNFQDFLNAYVKRQELGRKRKRGEITGAELMEGQDRVNVHLDQLNKLLRTNWKPYATRSRTPIIEPSDIREDYTTEGLENNREIVIYAPEVAPFEASDSVHFGTDTKGTALVWVRFGETTDSEGKRVLVIDEIQSNRHQEGRENGYTGKPIEPDGRFGAVGYICVEDVRDDSDNGRMLYLEVQDANHPTDNARIVVSEDGMVVDADSEYMEYSHIRSLIGHPLDVVLGKEVVKELGPLELLDVGDMHSIHDATEEGTVPPAPFEKNWHELGMKRMIRYAAEHGYDKIAWTSGAQQARRYNLGRYISAVRVDKKYADGSSDMRAMGTHDFSFTMNSDGTIASSTLPGVEGHTVQETFGKELGEKIMNLTDEEHRDTKKLWIDNFRIEGYESLGTIIHVDGEKEFYITVDRDGNINSFTAPSQTLWSFKPDGDNVYQVFGYEDGSRIVNFINRGNREDTLVLEEEGHAQFIGKDNILHLDKDVVFGGEGMKAFYDRILKQFTEKYIKKWGARVGVVTLPDVEEAGREMWGFDVTPQMKSAVMGKGQPLFQSRYPKKRVHRPAGLSLTPEEQAEVDRQRAEVRAKYEGTDEWLKAPNGEASNLPEDLWVTVRTEAFKKWFGDWEKAGAPWSGPTEEDSAPDTSSLTPTGRVAQGPYYFSTDSENVKCGLLDENGEPLLVWHGTPSRFERFRYGDIGFHFGNQDIAWERATSILQILFNPNYRIENAGLYAGFLNLRNPLRVERDIDDWNGKNLADYLLTTDDVGVTFQLTDEDRAELKKLLDYESEDYVNRRVREMLKDKGYDGILYDNYGESGSGEESYIIFNAEQFKEAENLGTFSTDTADFYFQSPVTSEEDAKYVEAEAKGDTATAQKMVDKAAKAVIPNAIKVYHYGDLGNDLFTTDQPVHFGTEEAARQRISGKYEEMVMEQIEYHQDEDGRWWWRDPETGEESNTTFPDEEAAKGNAAGYAADITENDSNDDYLDDELTKIHAYYISGDDLMYSQDMVNDWGPKIEEAKGKGYKGIKYTNRFEDRGSTSYIIFDAEGMKLADPFTYDDNGNLIPLSQRFNDLSDDIRYQNEQGGHRGAISFDDDMRATIALFEGAADGSTLIHETGHYIMDMMRHFVESGTADERMKSDYAKLTEWATITPEAATRGYEAYKASLEEGETPMDFDTWKDIEESERLARAFEAYCMEGKSPSAELDGAFATLRKILLHVYRYIQALGVKLTDDVRQVFDGMLASEITYDRDSIVREAAEQIDRELLGLSQSEVKTFRELIQKSNEQAIQKMTAEKNAQLKELRKQWRAEAKVLMDGDPVYNVWYAVQKEGPIDYVELEEITGEYVAQKLRAKGLATNPGRKSKAKLDKDGNVVRPAGYYSAKSGKHPATMAAEAGFDSVEEMVDELLYSKSPQDFTKEYMADEERKFNEKFEMSEAAQSVNASIEALEKLADLLAIKGGMEGYRLRRAMLRREAREELDRYPVGRIVSDKKLIADCRMNARALTKAANESDFATAFERAKALRFNLEVLRMKSDARKVVEDLEKLLKKARHAKKGVIYGDHQDALKDLSYRFGFTKNEPKIMHTAASVVREFNDEASENGDEPLEVQDWILESSLDYRKMQMGAFRALADFAAFLDGEGRALVSARETAFRESVKKAVEGSVAELKELPHKYTRNSNVFVHGWRSVIQWGTKLRNIIGMATNWKADSQLQKLYDEMAYAESEQTQIMAEPMRQCTEALQALHTSTRNIDFSVLSDIPFPQDVRAEGYRKWNAEKVIAACLNMGTTKNRQRLIDGYEWGEKGDEYANRLASMLTDTDWQNVQKIWDAIGGELFRRTARTFKEEYHYDLKEEEAMPFDVTTRDGVSREVRGGYYPLEYLYHKNTVVNDRADAAKNAPTFRRASFTFTRNEKVTDPLALSLNLVYTHVFDTSHYISHRATMRKVLRVIKDREFQSNFQQTQGFERYKAMRELIENVAAPGAALKGMTSDFENWGRAIVTASALWASPSVVAMQLSSITYGLDELGAYYLNAAGANMAHPFEMRDFVLKHSGLMRDRVNLKDLDLRQRANEFHGNALTQTRRIITEIGYSPMRFVDLAVAIPAWKAAYDKAMDEGVDESHAVAYADEFVAKTQGSTRAIDLSPLQLKAYGRGLTIFFSAVSAGSTMGTKTINRLFSGKMSPGEAAYATTMNLVLPLFLSCLIRYAVAGAGADDPDKAVRALLRELITNPFQGVPIIRDIADFVAGRTVGKSGYAQRTVFENTALRGASDLVVTAYDGVEAACEDNPERALYKLADASSMLFQVPVIRVYERLRRMLVDWTGDEDVMPDIDKETKPSKKKKRRRR